MSMQELTDDQLDGLFRKSAEEFDDPYDPAAWEAMQGKLDDHDRLTLWQRWRPWGIAVLLLLLLTGGGWYAYQKGHRADQETALSPVAATVGPNTKAIENQAQSNVAATTTRSQNRQLGSAEQTAHGPTPELPSVDAAAPSVVAEAKPQKKANRPITGQSVKSGMTDEIVAMKRPVAGSGKTAEPLLLTRSALPTVAERNRLTLVADRPVQRLSKPMNRLADRAKRGRLVSTKNLIANSLTVPYAITPTPSFTKRSAANEGNVRLVTTAGSVPESQPIPELADANRVALPALHELTIRPAQWPKLPGLANREVVQPATVTPVSVPATTRQTGLSIRFMVSPDLSAIGLKNFQRPGTNVGLMAEYRLASRWSVQAGVLRSTKVYRASGSDYVSPRYVHVQPESVDGQCNVLDIPVNVRYDVVLRPGKAGRQPGRWFVSGGTTSYVLLQEEYTSNFANPNDANIYPWQWQPINARSGGYLFSQLNLSVGYERALSRRLSWQVEPFLKAPLKRVGYYNINLLSTGAFFSIRYKL